MRDAFKRDDRGRTARGGGKGLAHRIENPEGALFRNRFLRNSIDHGFTGGCGR
jgi:hypothetical protein